MLWNPFTSFLKCFFSFSINFILTFASHSSSFSISHTEDIISLDSTVDTTVAWDWFTESLNLSMLLWWVYSEESGRCTINSLISLWNWRCMDSSIIFILFSSIFSLFFKSCIWSTSAIKRMNLGWWNWL